MEDTLNDKNIDKSQQIQDNTIRGIDPLKGLNRSVHGALNEYRAEEDEAVRLSSPKESVGYVGVNDSRLDRRAHAISEVNNLANFRGEEQSSIWQIGNGIVKAGVYAGTTFLDGTLGLLYGIGQSIYNGTQGKEHPMTGMWDNALSKGFQTINSYSEKILPNYYTDQENKNEWYDNIFTANFLGDKFIKNLGFTVGAFYSGSVYTSLFKVMKLPTLIAGLTKSIQAPKAVSAIIGTTMSAVNEGRIEALNNSTGWFKEHKGLLDKRFGVENDDTSKLSENDLQLYNDSLNELNDGRIKMGNTDFLLNLPILLASNAFQFAKLYARGYDTARKVSKVVGNLGNLSSVRKAATGTIKGISNALSEGKEEVEQQLASDYAGARQTEKINNFYLSRTDPDAEEKTNSWLKTASSTFLKTMEEGSTWEQFTIGALTGGLGMVQFKKVTGENDNNKLKLTLNGGILGEIRENRLQKEREKALVKSLNERVNSPHFKELYQGMIRHSVFQDDMDNAVINKDEFSFKNAENSQLVSDIIMFNNVGKLNELKDLIKTTYDISDKNLNAIIDNTTSVQKDANGNDVYAGPFVDKKGNRLNNTDTEKMAIMKYIIGDDSIVEGQSKFKTSNEMADKIKQSVKEVLSTIGDYQKIQATIDADTNEGLSDEQLEELTWMKMQKNNFDKRNITLAEEVTPIYKKTEDGIKSELDYSTKRLNALDSHKKSDDSFIKGNVEHSNNKTVNEENKENKSERDILLQKKQRLTSELELLHNLTSLNAKSLVDIFNKHPEVVKSVNKLIVNNEFKQLTKEEIDTFNSKTADMYKLSSFSNDYQTKYDEYSSNPTLFKKETDHIQAVRDEKFAKKKSNKYKNKLVNAANVQEFRDIINSDVKDDVKEQAIKDLEKENNEVYTNFKEVEHYAEDVLSALNTLDSSIINDTIKKDAEDLFEKQHQAAQNLKDIANPNSVHLADSNSIYDDSLTVEENATKFQNARYALSEAMDKVNNDVAFKDKFDDSYKTVKTKTNEKSVNEEIKENTEDLDDALKETAKDIVGETKDEPIEKHRNEDSLDTNKKINSEEPSIKEDTKNKKYYKPTIPKFNIAATTFSIFDSFKDVMHKYGSFFETYRKLNSETKKVIKNYINKVKKEGILTADKYFSVDTIKSAVEESGTKLTDYESKVIENELASKEKKSYDFSEIYDYLDNAGAFKYVDDGNLLVGDEIGFMIDPEFEESVKDKSWHTAPTVFIVKGTQVIGSLDEGPSMNHFVGLAELVSKIREEYKKAAEIFVTEGPDLDNENKFYATFKSKVSQIMIGKVPITNTNRSLREIIGVKTETNSSTNQEDSKLSRVPILAIMKNMVLFTGKANIKNEDIMRFSSMDNREGRTYILIPNAAGKYTPMAVWTQHFNEKEFDINNITYSSTPLGKALTAAINKLASVKSEDDLKNAISSLKHLLYLNNIHINFLNKFNPTAGIRIEQTKVDADGNEIYITKNGKKERQNLFNFVIKFNTNDPNIIGTFDSSESGFTSVSSTGNISVDTISNNIIECLQKMNLHLQINANEINSSTYNETLIMSDALVSDIAKDKVEGSWFTTDYYDSEGKQHTADVLDSIPVVKRDEESIETPNDTGSNTSGVIVMLNSVAYIVDSKTGKIYDLSNKEIDSPNALLIKDIAYANVVYGNATVGTTMVDNKILLPNSNKILDRDTNTYLTGDDYTNTLKKIMDQKSKLQKAKDAISSINQSQSKIDKTKTTNDSYSILEDDNEYHTYTRINKILNKNNHLSNKDNKYLKDLAIILAKKSNNVKEYNNYITYLGRKFNIDISEYNNKIDIISRNNIIDIISNTMLENINQDDSTHQIIKDIIKKFFTSNEKQVKPEGLSLEVFNTLINSLTSIRETIENNGETFYGNDIILYNKYPDETRVAENVDVLSVDKLGNLKIYKIATSNNSFYTYTDKNGNKKNTFKGNSNSQIISTEEYYTKQLSALKNLFESQFNATIQSLSILPVVVTSKEDKITNVNNESEISIKYDPSVNISLNKKDSSVSSEELSDVDKLIQKEQALKQNNEDDDDDIEFRLVQEKHLPKWNKNVELAWLKRVLPKLSEQQRIQIINGYIKAGENGAEAYGQFYKGIITLSNIAARGTTYHEAFHSVFNLLLDFDEKHKILEDASKIYSKTISDLDLEENLAEDFRRYIQAKEHTNNPFKSITNFFKRLYLLVKYSKYFNSRIFSLFKSINNGNFSKETIPIIKDNSNNENVDFIKTPLKEESKESNTPNTLERRNKTNREQSIINNFRRAREIERILNRYYYRTEQEAISAFNKSGINKDYFYRITSNNPNGSRGYKIQLLTNAAFDNYKNDILDQEEMYNEELQEKNKENRFFDLLDPDIQMELFNKGWTKEDFDAISQTERDIAINCL